MEIKLEGKRILGINGIGRIGKLTLWNNLHQKYYDGIVVNAGREIGKKLEDAIAYLTTDSTYGTLDRFLYGYSGQTCNVKIIDRAECLIELCGIPIKILKTARNPRDINWAKEGVRLVIDCTGMFLDPTRPSDHPKGSVRGHLEAGAEKVIVSAPFKIADVTRTLPEDSATFVYGINHSSFNPLKHNIISAASCTTTGLAHMVKPLVDTKETSEIITASMTTVHASTNNQSILDVPPKAGSKDLRRNRAVFNNIIPTSTGAAIALEEIIPEIKKVGFMADSIRVPTSTVSLISLNLTFPTLFDENGNPVITQDFINDIYRKAAIGAQKDLLIFSEQQNVSSDLMGCRAAVVIEGLENHTRTGFLSLGTEMLRRHDMQVTSDMNIPVTHAKIFGWYDNEFGCYVNCMGKLAKYIDKNLI
ncbi:MAG: glyceraldehyde 3-phosphate dehydrogenase NAD-binding domain-containing protein [Candidatus Pelethousia sp.]|nr:glyceraldehyde 3-phosphate dehydrogenase NAD-binding domain-containing protein [Candidatus Pelethousia sp.]